MPAALWLAASQTLTFVQVPMPTNLCNKIRAALLLRSGMMQSPMHAQDADECIRLAPDFAKGYSRKGHLQFFMKEYEKALETYDAGLKHDPANEELREGKQRTLQAIAKVCPSTYPKSVDGIELSCA